jgi:TM2 domain-containing membrane protein YozV
MYRLLSIIFSIFGCQFRVMIVLLLFVNLNTGAQQNDSIYALSASDSAQIHVSVKDTVIEKHEYVSSAKRESKRVVAALLCLALGPFGAHRLYLGTQPQVPALYSITLGGGLGFIPVIDFIVIVFTKNLNKYKNNNRVFMWAE